MQFWTKKSIRVKLIFINAATSLTVLALAVACFLTYEYHKERNKILENMISTSKLIADQSTAALSFNDVKTAEEILNSLKGKSDILTAVLFDGNGQRFASYLSSRAKEQIIIDEPTSSDLRYEFSLVEFRLSRPVTMENEVIGTLVIVSELTTLYKELGSLLLILLIFYLAAAFIIVKICDLLQKIISKPIKLLTSTAEQISREKNYSIRVPKFSEDELGVLVDQFNHMLKTINDSQRDLSESETKFRGIVENSADLIMLNHGDGATLYVSPAVRTLFGCEPEGFSLSSEIIHPEDYGKVLNYLNAARKGLAGRGREYRIIAQDKQIKWVSHSWTPIKTADKSGLIVSIIRDITEAKEMVHEREKMQAQVLQSSKLASIGELAAGVGHEINNPLAIVQGYANLLQTSLEDANIDTSQFNDVFKGILEATNRIKDIANGLRTFARMDTEHLGDLDVHDAINKTTSLIEVIYKKDQVALKKEFLATQPIIKGNIGKFQQIIMNLLSNAKDALEGKPGALIVIRTRNVGDKIIIEVCDNGKGIKPEHLARIFETFFTTKPVGKGTGLGLGITLALINFMKGKIEVQSTVGVGTTFTITFDTSLAAAQETEKTEFKMNPLRGQCLVVDDEAHLRVIVCKYLETMGVNWHEASGGQEALVQIANHKYDLVITDLKMPAMSGEELIKETRKRNHSNVKFVVMTGGIATEFSKLERDALRGLADGFLNKPFSVEELYTVINPFFTHIQDEQHETKQ